MVATVYGRSYFKFVKTLQHLKINYDSILPNEINQSDKRLILTTMRDVPNIDTNLVLYEEEFNADPTVIKGLIIQKLESGMHENSLVLGIDPGNRIGLSVFYHQKEIERSTYTSLDELISHVVKILAGLKAHRKIVKIGNGNMRVARQITNLLNLKFCSHFELEFVDERKTSLRTKNYNKRGERDKMSARYISQREGYRHLVLPLSRTG
ncbi:MAG TPA: RuvX/YqgF family protein [Nitrosopumilaceae archaeon]|nr:RuvX/YqgF family protein [Nitrosopumilaceae archaeon]